ncbi:MAG: hypothetical protein LBQ88_05900 [Treponema sp.]|jgi:hypothetical protein|nr:hypothetical protein [Treponema sp.]
MKKSNFFVLGMLIIALGLAGCDNGSTDEPKSLTLTGLPTGKAGVWVGMNSGKDDPTLVARGWASLSENKTTVTIPLKINGENTEDWWKNSPGWTGTGEYFLFITLQVDFEGDETQYFYSAGQPIPENMSSGVKKFNFDTASKTLNFNQFAEPKD